MEELRQELPLLNLLRHVFSAEPTKELLEGLGRIDPRPPADKELTGLGLMLQAIRKNENRVDAWLEELAVEFARLFIGPLNPPAVPYASFYLSENHSLMSEETLEVRRRYLEAGLAVKNLHRIPDDYIGFELDFLYYLTARFLELSEISQDGEAEQFLRIRRDFLKDHFALWVPLFARRIIESTQEEFYGSAASLLLEMADYYQSI